MNVRTATLARPSPGRAARRPWAGRARTLFIIAITCAVLAVAVTPATAAGELTKVGASGQRYVWSPGGC
jgi:hypothetical protein